MKVLVVGTGTANTASVLAGLRRAGAEPELSHDREDLRRADHVVLPGVGAFAAALQKLKEHDLLEILKERIIDDRPTMGICLGLQLLCDASEESPDAKGLGLVRGKVTRFPNSVRVPQLGWNKVSPQEGCQLLNEGYAYFANSFRLVQPPSDWSHASTEHASTFVSALERGSILACQFHPELSGAYGLALIKRWLNGDSAC